MVCFERITIETKDEKNIACAKQENFYFFQIILIFNSYVFCNINLKICV